MIRCWHDAGKVLPKSGSKKPRDFLVVIAEKDSDDDGKEQLYRYTMVAHRVDGQWCSSETAQPIASEIVTHWTTIGKLPG